MNRIKDFFRTFLLFELLKGMMLTGRYMFARKITVHFPEEKTPQSPRFRGSARASPLPEWRRALHRLQAVRSGMSGACNHDRIRAARGRHAPYHALRHRSDQVHILRILRRILSGRLDRRDRILEYHGEKRGDLIYTKEMLLAVGDRYEEEIARDRAADAGYR